MVTAPFFLATKLEAFKCRGKGDLFGSRDLEDVIFLVDGRDTLATEVRAESRELQNYISAETGALLATKEFINALPGFLLPDAASQSRISIVVQRLKDLAAV